MGYATTGQLGRLFLIMLFSGYVLAGFTASIRTRELASGPVVSMLSHFCGMGSLALWWAISWRWATSQMIGNPYWINAWHSSTSLNGPFQEWVFWDNVGALVFGGGVFLIVSAILGTVGAGLSLAVVRLRRRAF